MSRVGVEEMHHVNINHFIPWDGPIDINEEERGCRKINKKQSVNEFMIKARNDWFTRNKTLKKLYGKT